MEKTVSIQFEDNVPITLKYMEKYSTDNSNSIIYMSHNKRLKSKRYTYHPLYKPINPISYDR